MDHLPIKTTKLRALRVPLDFDRVADGAWKWKIALTALAALGAVFYSWYVLYADQGEIQAAPGPVANVHAMWESQCFACHVDDGWLGRHPMREDAWSAEQTSTKFAREIDLKCRQCHDGPEHHQTEQPTDVASCASCHAEHGGRGASLARVDDRHCLVCHEDLARHLHETTAGIDLGDPADWRFAPVTGFHKRHPEFSSIQQDPGMIKFNHKLHMSLGLTTPEHGSQPWTWDRFSPEDRSRYQEFLEESTSQRVTAGAEGEKVNDEEKVQLNCWACHQLDGTDAGMGGTVGATNLENDGLGNLPVATPPRAAGSYMLPIRYEKDCQACHPLYFDPTQKQQVVPHRASPDEIREFLVSIFAHRHLGREPSTDESQRIKLEVRKRWETLKYLPQKPGSPPRADIEQMLISVAKAEIEVRHRCVKCHEFQEETTRDEVELVRDLKQNIWSPLLPEVRPANVPELWLKHARFDHAAHRALDCLECHRRASAEENDASRTRLDVLIPSRDNCQQCHRPAVVNMGVRRGGARFDCVECHRYHGGDHPLHGLGARRRGPPMQKGVAEFGQGRTE